MTEKEELQYLFDKSYNHIMTQGEPSFDANSGYCQYHSDNGLQCAAGPFIVKYSEGMEEKDFTEVVEHFTLDYFDPIAFKHSDFVGLLQKCHDLNRKKHGNAFITAFQRDMEKVAYEHGLTAPE